MPQLNSFLLYCITVSPRLLRTIFPRIPCQMTSNKVWSMRGIDEILEGNKSWVFLSLKYYSSLFALWWYLWKWHPWPSFLHFSCTSPFKILLLGSSHTLLGTLKSHNTLPIWITSPCFYISWVQPTDPTFSMSILIGLSLIGKELGCGINSFTTCITNSAY